MNSCDINKSSGLEDNQRIVSCNEKNVSILICCFWRVFFFFPCLLFSIFFLRMVFGFVFVELMRKQARVKTLKNNKGVFFNCLIVLCTVQWQKKSQKKNVHQTINFCFVFSVNNFDAFFVLYGFHVFKLARIWLMILILFLVFS